jgi:hypothetical protein
VLREVTSHSYALASVVEPHEQAHGSAQSEDTLGESASSAAQPLQVMAQVGIDALNCVGLLFGFGYNVSGAFRPQHVRVDRRLVCAVVLGRRQAVYYSLYVFPA